jgi:hypothetical protein
MVMIQEEKYRTLQKVCKHSGTNSKKASRNVGGGRQCKYITRGMPGPGLMVYDRILTSYLATCSLLSNTL